MNAYKLIGIVELAIVTELQMAFEAFDYEKKGCINVEMVGTILTLLGHELSPDKLKEVVKEIDEDGTTYL